MEDISNYNIHEGSFGWHAIYTRHQHEKTIARLLSDRGFEVFLPLYATARRWKDRTKRLSLPLFPCYVFIWGGLERRLDIVTAPGFHSFVTVGNRPAMIPQPEIEAIRRALEKGSAVEPFPFLKSGDVVRIKSGPLEGIEGILVRKKNSFRLVLSVELLQKSVAVEVDATMVERVAGRSGAAPQSWLAATASTI
ncbi:MAG: UpxY family transcription antiterminator [Terriglobia bacterium]|jgi:transcription antitermination factor NusG